MGLPWLRKWLLVQALNSRVRLIHNAGQLQPGRRGASWQITIRNQRRGIAWRLDETNVPILYAEGDSWLQFPFLLSA